MEETVPNTTPSITIDTHENDFQNTSRVGRRNALPDILNDDGTTKSATGDLPEKLSALTTNDSNEPAPSVSPKSDQTGKVLEM